ncbi:Zona pellucida sperm-binding protein 3 [Nibea albiflora]|uniref:Zona pellucida sperm-binding protein 3 n=1 Tax=Nibea albiflora TaxID=240163 RepID=A0ACB7FHT9_NIBAL|nr:Zona pellucida sperm-binding protein 3 [Nibea albiflora]
MRPGEIPSDFAYLPDVSVTCSTSDFVVRVKPAFYGLGADADELKLGNTCKTTGVLGPYGDLLFTYPLTACDAVRQSPRGYLVYKFVLHYEPSPKRFPSRAHPIDVHIECRYPRNHHVYQLTVKPTWQTVVMRKRLKGRPNDFQIELMDDSWSKPAKSQVYQLGKTVNFQVSAPHLPTHKKLYINTCYATPASGSKSSLKHIIIDNFGCMLDSKRDPGASQFISRTDKYLRFSLKAFQFTSDPDTEVRIYCSFSVTSEEPSPAHKSCTYRGNRWKALAGDDSVCECCDSQCVTSKPRRAMMEDGESTISHYIDDLQSHENQWGMEEEEEEEEEEVYTDEEEEPLEEEERYIVQGEYSEGEEEEELEEGNDEISDVQQVNQKEGEVLEHTLPSDVRLERELVSEENREHTVRGEEDDGSIASEKKWKDDEEEEEMTWYFTWR